VNAKYEQAFIDTIHRAFGRNFDTFGQAAAWLLGDEGQAAIDVWAKEDGEVVEIPAFLARPLDQVFGDTAGLDREALPGYQAAQVAAALDSLDLEN
jgi:hypothetical protein